MGYKNQIRSFCHVKLIVMLKIMTLCRITFKIIVFKALVFCLHKYECNH
jgi:hypothetical protein